MWFKHRFPEDHNCKGRPISKLVSKDPIPTKHEEISQLDVQSTFENKNTWPVWDEEFATVDKLISHSEIHFKDIIEQEHQEIHSQATESCPICFKLYPVPELIRHWETEHVAA